LCGSLFGIVVGLQIVYKKEVFLILSIALSATRRRKTFNTSLSHVLLQLARQFWYAILQPINLSPLTPTRSVNFADLWKHAERRLPAGGASLQGVPPVAILWGQKAYCPKPRDGCGAGLVDGRVVVWSYVLCFNVIVFYLS